MWSRNFGSATQGVRKPGVWEPCPGHTTTITYLVSQSFDGLGCVTPTKNSGEHCLGYTTLVQRRRALESTSAIEPTINAACRMSDSRAPVASQPITSETRLRR